VIETDEQLFLMWNAALSGPASTTFFSWVTHLGNGLVLACAILPVLFFVNRPKFYGHAIPMVVAVALSGGFVNLLKAVIAILHINHHN